MVHYWPMLRAETDYDGEVFADDLSGASAGSSRFLECTFQRCDLSELRAPRSRFSETSLYAVHGAGLDLAESSWSDCLVQGARLGAVAMYGAELSRVRFEGCRLVSPDFTKGTFKDVDLTGADLAGPRGVAGLRGATLSALQLIDLGPALAAELGIRVAD